MIAGLCVLIGIFGAFLGIFFMWIERRVPDCAGDREAWQHPRGTDQDARTGRQ
jgi:hypothetical protein